MVSATSHTIFFNLDLAFCGVRVSENSDSPGNNASHQPDCAAGLKSGLPDAIFSNQKSQFG
jgi:hypothetical protein